MNVLFLPLNKKEIRWSSLIAILYIGATAALEAAHQQTWQCLLTLPVFAAVILLALRFWKESVFCISLTGKQLIWKPLVGALACRALCFLVHDLFMMLGFPYFVATDWGPMLWDCRSAALENDLQANFWLIAIAIVVLAPIVEEFIFRAFILGTVYRKSSILAVIVSTLLFAALHVLPYAGAVSAAMSTDSTLYLCLYGFQYVVMGVFLSWLYISTDSIFAPIILHIIFNYALVF